MSLPSDQSMGQNTEDSTLQRRSGGMIVYRGRQYYGSEFIHSGIQLSSHQQQVENPATIFIRMGTRIRYTPYAVPHCRKRGNSMKHYQTHVNMEKEQKPPETVEEKKEDETSGSWHKIIIPFGKRYEEKWLLNLIQKQCSVPFTPVEFHYDKMQAQFFVENVSIAFALKKLSGKILDENNEKIFVLFHPCDAPQSVQKTPKSEKVEQIKLTMNKQYGVSQGPLGIQRLFFDPGLMTCDTVTAPNPRFCMAASLQINKENMSKLLSFNQSKQKSYLLYKVPSTKQNASNIAELNLPNNEVKSAGHLAKGKGLEPEQMSANKSRLCSTIPDKSTNISCILELFPKLSFLDGQEPPPPTNIGTEGPKKLPTCKGSFFGSDALKSLVLQFLQQYYLIYDSGDRQGLLDAYHDEACFSLTVAFNTEDQALSSLCEYFKDNRNMKNLMNPYLRFQLLKHTKRDTVYSLSVLPRTQHDTLSFVVDLWFQTEKMLCFSVSGVFKEVEGRSQGSVRAFSRTFIATSASNSGLCIVNDEMCVRDATPEEIQSPHLSSDFLNPPSAPYPPSFRSSRKCWKLSSPHSE